MRNTKSVGIALIVIGIALAVVFKFSAVGITSGAAFLVLGLGIVFLLKGRNERI
jgi:hypothetical protein